MHNAFDDVLSRQPPEFLVFGIFHAARRSECKQKALEAVSRPPSVTLATLPTDHSPVKRARKGHWASGYECGWKTIAHQHLLFSPRMTPLFMVAQGAKKNR